MPSSRAKSPLFYGAVLLVTGSSVVFGLDWTRAPLPPMHETEASVQAAKAAAVFPPPIQRVAKAAPRVVTPVAQPKPATKPVVVAKVTPNQAVSAPPPIVAPEQDVAAPQVPQPKCDIAACSAAYRSFRESDCTWQPYEGPRRFCDKGNPPQEVASAENAAASEPVTVSDKCDIAACKDAYFTFNPADCTYQPSDGPRRLCTRGTPPKPTPNEASLDPAVAAANAANAANAENQQDQAKPSDAAPKCDIEACKRAYFTFNAADCTYQPSDGPRRLCTKGTPPKAAAAQPAPASTPRAAVPNHPVPPGLVPRR
jgi:hypothetical protein